MASSAPEIRIGDVGLFSAFVAALDLAPVWKRRLIKDFNRKSSLKHDLEQMTLAAANGSKEYQGVLAALAGSDPKAAHHLVTDLLSIAGIATVGGRSVAEIADRFLEQSALNAPTRLPRETRALIERFLSIAGDPDDAAGELRALAADAKIALGAGARSVRDPHRLSRRARRRRARDQIRHRFRPRLRLLHRLRLRAARSRAARARWSPAAVMTACSRGSAPRSRSRRSALPPRSTNSPQQRRRSK